MIDKDSLQERKAAILPHLNERQRRLFAAAEAKAAGYGGIAAVSRVTGIAASTIGRGLKDLESSTPPSLGRVRRPGGGRKSLTASDPRLLEDLNALVEPNSRGDPMSPLRWTCKSLRRLSAELNKLGHQISHTVVGELLKQQKFSLQANSKTREGANMSNRVQLRPLFASNNHPPRGLRICGDNRASNRMRMCRRSRTAGRAKPDRRCDCGGGHSQMAPSGGGGRRLRCGV